MAIDKQKMQRFGLLWTLLTIAGLTIGFIVGFILGDIGLGYIGLETTIGVAVGFMQWLALRRVIKTELSWVLACLIGFLISSGIHTLAIYSWSLPEDLGNPIGALGWTAAFVIGGTLTGIMQQRILRHHVGNSGWWIPASIMAWGMAMAGLGIYFAFFHIMKSGPIVLRLINNVLIPMLVPSVILGIITAAALIWMMRRPVQQT